MIARVVGDKGVREFVEAARVVRQVWPDARFALLGFVDVANRTAIGRVELQRWVAEGVIDYLEPTSDVRPAIERSDFIVLPSYREGLSRVLIEAAAMGRPMIASDVPGCREIVHEGETGFLCAPRDASSLAQALIRAAQVNDEEWLRLSGNARRLAESSYSDDLVAKIYRDALLCSGIVPPVRSGS
jgi:glycosyltransferase involved in cell wall biosynthesis